MGSVFCSHFQSKTSAVRANLCQFIMLTNRPTFFGQFYLYDTSAENFQCVCVMSGCEGHPSQDLLIKGGGKQTTAPSLIKAHTEKS